MTEPGGLAQLQLDPRKPNHITLLGRKGSGKSVLAERFWRSYPGDRLVLDPTGDVDAGDDAEKLTTPLPTRWRPLRDASWISSHKSAGNDTSRVENKRSTLRFVPDMGAATYVDDMDRAVGLAFTKGDCLLWVDEVGELTNAHNTPPHVRRLLHQSRHRRISMMFCGPRPLDINPLVMSQADYLAVFKLPNPADRKRVADVAGLDLDELEEALADATAREHGYVWIDQHTDDVLIMPPLPHRTPRPTGRRFVDDDATEGV